MKSQRSEPERGRPARIGRPRRPRSGVRPERPRYDSPGYAWRAPGFSLLEVILALAILTGAVAVLGELARMGMDSARHARFTARAQLLAESKLNQIAAGWAAAESTGPTEFSSDDVAPDPSGPVWLYAVDVQQTEELGVVAVRVTVTQDRPGGRPIEVAITRWMVDKTLEETMAADAEALITSGSGT